LPARVSVLLTSYVDNSYVVLSDPDLENLVRRTENCLSTHNKNLEEIGMRVNESKTEIILFGKEQPKVVVNVKGVAVESKDCIKALGVLIDKGLTWRLWEGYAFSEVN